MTTTKQQFKNSDYTVDSTSNPGCQVRFEISVSPKASDFFYRKAVKSINKAITVPGFRKGKAPDERVIEKYGSEVEKKWREELFNNAFKEAVVLSNIFPYSEKSIKNGKIESITRDGGAEVWVEFEAMPEIPDIDPSKITLETFEAEAVGDEEIDRVVEDFCYQHASWEDVKDRGVKDGDFVDVDIENLDAPGNFICKDTRLEVREDKIGKWLHNQLIGMKVAENKEALSEKDDTISGKSFTPTNCKVTVKGIQKGVLHPRDDELAKKFGAESYDTLIEFIRRDLENNKTKDVQEKSRKALQKALSDTYPFPVPESIVQDQTQRILSYQGRELLEKSKEDESAREELLNLEQKIHSDVEEIVRWQFLVRKISQENNIEVTKDEVIREVIMMSMSMNGGEMSEESKSLLYDRAISKIMAEKAADYLIGQMATN